ncbi:MFS transporter [Brevibacterium sp. GP-SGM9]|uniref:MFS transporter n=1 Tax=unclassified Brevibacterium TaxID=2614124 RepID=UPI001E2E8526|nr:MULTISPECIES: MFS transporter [unclassified Brevibacterium]MDK8433495.1 MFS transporter [Brevibacterium sp. H-BE7]
MDALTPNREHRKLFAYIGAGAMIDAYDIYVAAGVSAALVSTGFAGVHEVAVFMSMTFFGMLLGAATAGFVGDKFGRRMSYQINLLIFAVAGFAAALAPTFEFLVGTRFIMGIGLGAELVLAAAILGEFVPPRSRGRWTAMLGILVNSGLLFASAIGAVVISSFGWRWMFVIGAVLAVIVWIARTRCPESPRWLVVKGRMNEAQAIVERFERLSQTTLEDNPPASVTTATESRDTDKRPFWQLAVLGTVVAVGVNMFVYGFISWMPTFFVEQGIDVSHSLAYTTAMALGAPGGGLVCLLLINRLNRRTAIVAFSIIVIPLGLAYASAQSIIMIVIIGILLVTAIYTLVTFVLYSYMPELYPTRYRLRGTGISYTFARGASIVVPFVMSGLFVAFGIFGPIGFVCAMAICMIVVVFAIPVETRGRSLEEIA